MSILFPPSAPSSRLTLGMTAADVALPPPLRSPTANDDSTQGFAVGDLWQFGGQVWQAMRVTAGAAVWFPVMGVCNLYALDGLVGATIPAAYGTVKLRKAYAGSCLDVTRVSDGAVLTLGFVNDAFDAASLDSFLVSTTGWVSKWYDQSGGGNDATQSTAVNAPVINTLSVGGVRAVIFKSVVSGGSGAQTYMTIPSAAAFTAWSAGMIMVGRTQGDGQDCMVANLGSYAAALYASAGGVFQKSCMTVNAGTSTIAATDGDAVNCIFQNLGQATFYSQNDTVSGVGTGRGSTAISGGTLGDTGTGPSMHATALILLSSMPTAAQILNVRSALFARFNIAPQANDILVADGDSITFGHESSLGQGYPPRAISQLPSSPKYYNVGVIGQTIAVKKTQTAAWYTPIYKSNARRFVVLLMIGTNDAVSAAATATFANIQSYVSSIKNLGPNVRVAIATIPGRTASSANTVNQALNGLIQAGWSMPVASGGLGADALVDFGADATMGTSGVPANTTYFSDGLHPTDLGYSFLASVAAPKLAALLRA